MPFFTQRVYLQDNRECIDTGLEETQPIFRFLDLQPKAQTKFVNWIKDDSSIRTVRVKAKEGDIQRVLRDLNPILISPGWKGTFAYSTIYRWKERVISSMIFNSLFRRHPRCTSSWLIKQLLCTPQDILEKDRHSFTCEDCGIELPSEHESHFGSNLCAACETLESKLNSADLLSRKRAAPQEHA